MDYKENKNMSDDNPTPQQTSYPNPDSGVTIKHSVEPITPWPSPPPSQTQPPQQPQKSDQSENS